MQARDEQAATAKQKVDAEIQKNAQQQQRCNALKEELQILKLSGPVATVDANGKRTHLSDAQHAQKEQQLQSAIDKNCSS